MLAALLVYFCTLQAALAWSPGANLDVTSYTVTFASAMQH